jgi:uncharacterized membrane protein
MKHKKCITKSLTIAADTEDVFNVLSDIENWNLWTKSITKISFIKNSRFMVGGKATVLQPKLSLAEWTITEIIENKSFSWHKKSFGLTMTAKHIVESTPNGTVAQIEMIYEGLFASLIYRFTSKLTAEYLTMEINGLKNECEKMY